MAVAGPIASLALAVLLFALTGLVRGAAPDAVTGVLWYLAIINGVLALFNLVPAFPLDGGRVLRAALWAWRGDILWATRMASGAGNLFGTVLIMLGVVDILRGDFVNGMWRFLLGMFLRGAAEQSYQQVVAQRALSGTTVAQAMTRNPVALSPDLTIGEFIDDYVYRHHHRTFPVVRQQRLIGYIGTQQAVMIDRASWARTPVEQVMIACSTDDMVSPDVDALVALGQMRRTGRTRLYVVRAGRLVGILSLRDMLELLSTKLELGGDPISAAGRQGAGQGQNPARSGTW